MTRRNEWEEFFDGHALVYMDNSFTKNTVEEVDFVLEELRLPAGSCILDVGCGTGLSTRPLASLAELAVGVDPSPGMLREARRGGGPSYVRGVAEALPFSSAAFDLVTIGCAYHWCQPEAFLSAAHRVLRPDGHLVIYDNFFFGQSPRSAALLDWLSSEHWARLPRR